MIYTCCTDLRRTEVEGSALNGVDFLEVLDDPSTPPEQVQRTLFVHFVNPPTTTIGAGNLRIEGGERIRGIAVTGVAATEDDHVLRVRVDRAGDFSTYVLRLVTDAGNPAVDTPPPGIDPMLAVVSFSFKAACDTHQDCRRVVSCPPPALDEPLVDYLARDFPSFERLILDRMSALAPSWTERNPADTGVMLTEVLAYVGDHLSYEQDAVATEAYLGTARLRVSVRRHARLVDYSMHEGCNARVLACLTMNADLPAATPSPLPAHTRILTRAGRLPTVIAPDSPQWTAALSGGATVFETMADAPGLHVDHNVLHFHTWGSRDCCLPAGATGATLLDAHSDLRPGHVLILEEVVGPLTGMAPDADPMRRWPVRLTAVESGSDPLTGEAITAITWHPEDAVPFAMTVTRTAAGGLSQEVSVARGNVVLADHGLAQPEQVLPPVPRSTLEWAPLGGGDPCPPEQPSHPVPARYQPRLGAGPLCHAAPSPDPVASVAAARRWAVSAAVPAVRVTGGDGSEWWPRRDLIGSDATDDHFVAELDGEGIATLRFGDGLHHGARPAEHVTHTATYRTGNGAAGNIAAGSLAHVVVGGSAASAIDGVTNLLPAAGGVAPESLEDVREKAPVAFRTQLRAVTPDDYAHFAQQFPDPAHPEVLRAVVTFRWTGSWHTVFVTVERAGGGHVDPAFAAAVRDFLEPYRMAGHDIEVEGPIYVPLEMDMTVCVRPDYFSADVEAALRSVFSSRVGADGTRGLFPPDNFTFGQTVFLSPLYAAAQAVDGVEHVEVTTFERWGQPSDVALRLGRMALGRLEIARIDDDPNFPDHGVFRRTSVGGNGPAGRARAAAAPAFADASTGSRRAPRWRSTTARAWPRSGTGPGRTAASRPA